MNIDDGDIFLGEFANGALCSIQTSFVTVGNYPGIEARIYGSKGAMIGRLVEEAGICETLRAATPDQVEFREVEIPARFYPPGGSRHESWRTLFYANLVSSFISRDPERRPGERRRLRRRRMDPGSRSTPWNSRSASAAGSRCRWHEQPRSPSSRATTACGR